MWYAQHLFAWIYDYDEGAYSLGGRFISEGFLPYRDFTLVHPPLYDLTLGFIYKIFGYDFFLGRYFSVLLSVLCIILVFIIIRKLFNSTAALVGAALVAFFPGFFLLWYRAVQEPLGIFFVLLSLFFAIDFIRENKIGWRILLSGVCLGLALATKYTFLPVVAGLSLGFLFLSMRGRWTSLRDWFSRENLLFGGGVVFGFLVVTGYFIVLFPDQFISQTLSAQVGYRLNFVMPDLLHFFNFFQLPLWSQKITSICVILVIAVAFFAYFRRKVSRANSFIFIALFVSLVLSSTFNRFGELRYFVSPFLMTIIMIAAFVPELDAKTIVQPIERLSIHKLSSFAFGLAVLIFGVASLLILQRYDYSYTGPEGITFEKTAYDQVNRYLEGHPDKTVYSMSPIIPALSSKIDTTLQFDTFAFLEIFGEDPEALILREQSLGVDYFIVDPLYLLGFQKPQFGVLAADLDARGKLIASFVPAGLKILSVNVYEDYSTFPR
ncbi:ArnT family glycosyltransferase [Dehalogenimonas formicexedens]|nr:glycosyltransferase family 39 protein [Dehalogenimonas formicexedens]